VPLRDCLEEALRVIQQEPGAEALDVGYTLSEVWPVPHWVALPSHMTGRKLLSI
jgi:hypothetical protein